MKNLSRVVIIAIAIMIIVVAADGIVAWVHPRHTQPAIVVQTTISDQTTLPAPTSTVNPADSNAAQMSLAIVHKGEGVESALIRQFAAGPVAYGFNGKQDDPKAIHRWAGHQAALLAIRAGYYDWKFGAEVRVAAPDKMAYVIQKDAAGNLTVVEHAVTTSTATPTFSQGVTHVSSTTVGTSNFFGASPITGNKIPVPQGEYVYFPGE